MLNALIRGCNVGSNTNDGTAGISRVIHDFFAEMTEMMGTQ
jgi:hypothetical protein